MITKEQLVAFFKQDFPQADCITIEAVGCRSAIVHHKIDHQHLRPGGTVSGPTIMGLADAALYVAILGEIGLVAMAVTTNLNVNFLCKPAADKDLIAECQLIKVGKRSVVGEVSIFSKGDEKPVAHAVGTYSIPASS